MWALALLMLGAGVFITPTDWAGWFQHPNRPPDFESTRQGAVLLRVMLLISATALALAPLLLRRAAKHVARDATEMDDRDPISARVMVLVGLGLFIVGLLLAGSRWTESLWYDEIAPWMEYGRFGAGVVVGNYFDPSNHVLMTLLSQWTLELAPLLGGIEPAMRLPALLAYLATIPVMMALGAAAAGTRGGIIAGALTTCCPIIVLEGVEARGYAIMILAAAAMTWLWLKAERAAPNRSGWRWQVYAVVAALGIWAHVMTAFVPIGHALVMVFSIRRVPRDERAARLIGPMVGLGLGAVLTLTVYAPILPDFLELLRSGVLSAGEAFGETTPRLWGTEGVHGLLSLGGSWMWWAALPGLLLAGVGSAMSCRAAHRQRAGRALALALAGLPLMVLVVVLTGAWVYARFILFVMPGVLLALTLGVIAIMDGFAGNEERTATARLRPILAGVIAMGILGTLFMTELFTRPPRQPLREAVEQARANQPRGAGVLVIGLHHGVIRIYFPTPSEDPGWWFTTHAETGDSAGLEAMLTRHAPRTIIIQYPHLLTEPRREHLRGQGFTLVTVLPGWVDWGRGEVQIWRR